MTIVLTGCAGFIGYHVAKALLEKGEDVLGFDNLNNAYDSRLKHWRLGDLREKRNFQFKRKDILAISPRDIPPGSRIINLAARAGVRASLENPEEYVRTNLGGCLHLLNVARKQDSKTFLQASTSSVYGNVTTLPIAEDDDTSRPLSPYAASKKAAEVLAASYNHLYGLSIAVPRFFTVYGPAGRPDMSIFRFVRWIIEGRPVDVTGDGSQRRDFTYVDDIVDGVLRSFRLKGYNIFNLGSDHPYSIADVIREIEKQVKLRAKIQYLPQSRADVPATWADPSRAKRLMGWKPRTKMALGLSRTIKWYYANREMAKKIRVGDT